MGRDDAEKRIADHRDAQTASPSQTPGNRRRMESKRWRTVYIGTAVFLVLAVGLIFITFGLDRDDGAVHSVVWFGVAMIVLSVLIPAALVIRLIVREFKESPLRQPGTVELLTVASSRHYGANHDCWGHHYRDDGNYWELTSEMQIRLNNGQTFRGSYFTQLQLWQMYRTRRYVTPDGVTKIRPRPQHYLPHFDEWFRVGASLRCLYNPANPDEVLVTPFEARGDRVEHEDYVSFHSAT